MTEKIQSAGDWGETGKINRMPDRSQGKCCEASKYLEEESS